MVDNIINLPQNENNENKKQKSILEDSLNALTEVMPELEGVDGMSAILALPDEHFSVLAPAILMEMEKSLNNVNDKMVLVQALNASGLKSEDLVNAFSEIIVLIDEKLTTIPRPKREFIKRVLGMLCNAIVDTEGIAKKVIQIPIELCNENAKIPTYANSTDAGMDVYAIEDFTLAPGESKIIPTGLKVAVPLGYELQVRARSGISAKTKLILANGVGTIDSGYRGEIGIILENIEPKIKDIGYTFNETGKPIILGIEHGQSYSFSKGDRIAQLVLNEIPKVVFYQVENIEKIEGNRGGGFGSTGVK
jgi:dUTP pyrophosphatase